MQRSSLALLNQISGPGIWQAANTGSECKAELQSNIGSYENIDFVFNKSFYDSDPWAF